MASTATSANRNEIKRCVPATNWFNGLILRPRAAIKRIPNDDSPCAMCRARMRGERYGLLSITVSVCVSWARVL